MNFIVANVNTVVNQDETKEKLIKVILDFNPNRNREVLLDLNVDQLINVRFDCLEFMIQDLKYQAVEMA